jgi:hypothetical protein
MIHLSGVDVLSLEEDRGEMATRMLECIDDFDCPDGEECLSHSSLPAEQQGGDIGLCRAPCTTDDDCLTMHRQGGTIGYSDCTCQGPGLVGAGHCLANPTPAGGFTCLYTEPP